MYIKTLRPNKYTCRITLPESDYNLEDILLITNTGAIITPEHYEKIDETSVNITYSLSRGFVDTQLQPGDTIHAYIPTPYILKNIIKPRGRPPK